MSTALFAQLFLVAYCYPSLSNWESFYKATLLHNWILLPALVLLLHLHHYFLGSLLLLWNSISSVSLGFFTWCSEAVSPAREQLAMPDDYELLWIWWRKQPIFVHYIFPSIQTPTHLFYLESWCFYQQRRTECAMNYGFCLSLVETIWIFSLWVLEWTKLAHACQLLSFLCAADESIRSENWNSLDLFKSSSSDFLDR